MHSAAVHERERGRQLGITPMTNSPWSKEAMYGKTLDSLIEKLLPLTLRLLTWSSALCLF